MIKLLLLIVLFFLNCVTAPNYFHDSNPDELCLNVFLTIYHMNWSHPIHYDRVVSVLSEFEQDPSRLFNDQITLEIVIEQIVLGIEIQTGFLADRSLRLLNRVIRSNPPMSILLRIFSNPRILIIPELSDTLILFLGPPITRFIYNKSNYKVKELIYSSRNNKFRTD